MAKRVEQHERLLEALANVSLEVPAPKNVLRPLLQLLRTGTTEVRAEIAGTLGLRKTDAELVLAPLLAALEDQDAYVRSRAVVSLGNLKGAAKPAVPSLIRAIEKDVENRRYVDWAFEKITGRTCEQLTGKSYPSMKPKSLDLRMAPPDDPIYSEGWTIFSPQRPRLLPKTTPEDAGRPTPQQSSGNLEGTADLWQGVFCGGRSDGQ